MPYTSIEKPEIDFATSTALSEVRIQNNGQLMITHQCVSYFPQYRHSSDNDLERVTLFNCTLFRFYLQK